MLEAHADTVSIQAQLEAIHANLKSELADVRRIAVAIYDASSDMLKTFVHSTDGPLPFAHYDKKLSDVPSLQRLAQSSTDRVVDDIDVLAPLCGFHDRRLQESGYRSSYTTPLFVDHRLFGFLFFDSCRPQYFSSAVTKHHIGLYTRLIRLMLLHALAPASTLRSAVEITKYLGGLRDAETGQHLDRMSRYARLIAQTLANRRPDDALDDEFVEFVFLFAPLHDVGKIGVPDGILLKPGKLTADEFEIMKTHVAKGVEIVDHIAAGFGVGSSLHIEILRNIVRYHHEAYDGSGYLAGLAGEAIPWEARIVTVADVFDALTSRRPYKEAWPGDAALAFLAAHAGRAFDPACVEALIENEPRLTAIQRRFVNGENGFNGGHEAYIEGV